MSAELFGLSGVIVGALLGGVANLLLEWRREMWLRATLTEAAITAARTKNSYLAAQYQRLRGRRGHAKALTAVAHSISPPSGTCCRPASCTATPAATTTSAKTPTASPDAWSANSKQAPA